MQATDLRVALFSGNYNYTRDGANQTLNLLVGYLLKQGAAVRVYSPVSRKPAFPPVGDLVGTRSVKMPGGRAEYKLGLAIDARVRADLDAFAPNLVHVSAPDFLNHSAVRYAREKGIPVVASYHTRFETYVQYYGIGFVAPLIVKVQRKFYQSVD